MISRDFAEQFAAEWVDAWNRGDLATILSHYDSDVVFHSPRIRIVMGGELDFVRGKSELGQYWEVALARSPDLKFVFENLFVGSDTLTIIYRNHRSQLVAETFVFNTEGLVTESMASYVG